MIKYFCDFCGKELKRDTPEAKGLAVGNKFGSSVEYYDICKDCLDKIYEMIEDKKLREEKSWKIFLNPLTNHDWYAIIYIPSWMEKGGK